jgi:hypothetical protein
VLVGREPELRSIASEVASPDQVVTVFVHGPGGIGKTALLREASARAEKAHGFSVLWLDGRDIAPVPDQLEDALGTAPLEWERPLIILDSFEHVEALGGYLRRALIPSLPAGAAVLIASRRAPGPEWEPRGAGAGFLELGVEPLDPEGSAEVLRRNGAFGESAERARRWARGNPLALELVAASARRDPDGPSPSAPDFGERLIARLVEERLEGPHLATLATAAIARVTTPDLLSACLVGADPAAEWEWLCGRSFIERRGVGVAPHELVREAIRAGLRRDEPTLERELRRRVADHLYGQARGAAGPLAIIDLAELADSPALRWGFSWRASARFRVDGLHGEDLRIVDRALSGHRHAAVWEGSRRFLEAAPEHATVARDREDQICGLTISLTPDTALPPAAADPILGPRLAHARRHDRRDAVIWRDTVDLTRDPASGLIGLLGVAGLLAATAGSPRHGYLPINPSLPGARDFAAASGGIHLPDLDARIGSETIECHVMDWGPGGIVAAQRDQLYRELGLSPPPREAPEPTISVEVVREAFRSFASAADLSRSPLAHGAGTEERAESVRRALLDAVDRALGDGPGDALTKTVLLHGYLEREASHEAVAETLHLSRAAYFRRLRRGCERVASYISAG